MDIYTSTRVMPYVYHLVHRETGQFYFGSRTSKVKQKQPSHIDLPHYKTSSNYVKELGFQNFIWTINSEFFDPTEAYWHEQRLIRDHWGDQLLLNKYFVDPDSGKKKFITAGEPKSDQHREKLSAAKMGKALPQNRVEEMSSKWIIVPPQGTAFEITNMNEFCRESSLHAGAMNLVAHGKQRHHKGYRCMKA